MANIKLVISDLHLSDGSSPLDCFGERQQAAFAGLLATTGAPDGAFGSADSVELIMNGDCFDFLATRPYSNQRRADPATALQKLEKIIAAHDPFFAVLRSFVAAPGRSVTFIAGNHDIELCFVQVRTRISQATVNQEHDPRINFCLARFYRPLPDVYIEHGNHYDFWNHSMQGLWDEQGHSLTSNPASIPLSVGSLYYQSALHFISERHPYFDHFEPSLSNIRQIGLLCLLDQTLIRETTPRTMSLLSYAHQTHVNLALDEETDPVRLFEETMQDFVAFQADMQTQKQDWPARTAQDQADSSAGMTEYIQLRTALSYPQVEAIATIFHTDPEQEHDDVAQGIHSVLDHDPTLRYAIAGHTHMALINPLNQGRQLYFNPGSWTTRFAQPAPDAITADLVDWLRTTDWQHIPLIELTQFRFVLITAHDDEPAQALLCSWKNDNFQILS